MSDHVASISQDDEKTKRFIEHDNDLSNPSSNTITQTQKLVNPLSGLSKETIYSDVQEFCREKGLEDKVAVFQKGALLAQRPDEFENIPELDEEDLGWLRKAEGNKWYHPKKLYFAGELGDIQGQGL
jgi:hypothetical protein